MMPDQQLEAIALRLDLLAGLATVAEVVAWADRIVLADPAPDAAILDLAIAGHQSEDHVATLLASVPGPDRQAPRVPTPPAAMRRHFRTLLARVQAVPQDAGGIAMHLYQLAQREELPEAEFGADPYSLEDPFSIDPAEWPDGEDYGRAELIRYLERQVARDTTSGEDPATVAS